MNDMSELSVAFHEVGCDCKLLAEAFANIGKEILYLAPNKRVKHLALYGKKARVRKKNLNRIKRRCKQ